MQGQPAPRQAGHHHTRSELTTGQPSLYAANGHGLAVLTGSWLATYTRIRRGPFHSPFQVCVSHCCIPTHPPASPNLSPRPRPFQLCCCLTRACKIATLAPRRGSSPYGRGPGLSPPGLFLAVRAFWRMLVGQTFLPESNLTAHSPRSCKSRPPSRSLISYLYFIVSLRETKTLDPESHPPPLTFFASLLPTFILRLHYDKHSC